MLDSPLPCKKNIPKSFCQIHEIPSDFNFTPVKCPIYSAFPPPLPFLLPSLQPPPCSQAKLNKEKLSLLTL